MKNRISLDLNPQDVADFKAAQATQKRILLKWLNGVDLTDVGPGNAMGTEGCWTYCKDGYQFAIEQPKIYDPEELIIEEYGKDIDAATLLLEAKSGFEESSSRAGILLTQVGKDLMEQTHYIRKRGNDKRALNLDYVAHSDKLNALFEKRNEKAIETRKINDEIKGLREQLAQAQKAA
jgi:hypothetical protein